MCTNYDPAKRTNEEGVVAEIELVESNPFVTGLLHSVSGLLAILNENRQIIALNDSFLKMLGIDDPGKALGLRHGEVLQCINSDEEPAGCGASKLCSTCGAAIAIVSSLGENRPVERICALSASRGGKEVEVALLVRSHPIRINNNRFLLLFLQDITEQQQRAALERVFFHDVNNLITMLVGASDMLVEEEPSELAKAIHQTSLRLANEVAIQRCLSQSEASDYPPVWHDYTTVQIVEEIRSFFANHPAAHGKSVNIAMSYPAVTIKTDISLLMRVLCNMIINALEATVDNGGVKFWIEHKDNFLSFNVWNALEIPQDVALRIFQRNFSTKEQPGRGIGTYSMKLLGEKILGGSVDFSTSQQEGTIFRFVHII